MEWNFPPLNLWPLDKNHQEVLSPFSNIWLHPVHPVNWNCIPPQDLTLKEWGGGGVGGGVYKQNASISVFFRLSPAPQGPQVPHLLEVLRVRSTRAKHRSFSLSLAIYSTIPRSWLPPGSGSGLFPVPLVWFIPPIPRLSLSHTPDSLLKQCADIFVKTNLIFFPFWDRWKEIDVFISNRKKKKDTFSPFDSHFLGTKVFSLSRRLSLQQGAELAFRGLGT